jgi:molecular chaperone GrpE
MNPKTGTSQAATSEPFDDQASQEVAPLAAEPLASDRVSELQARVDALEDSLLRAKAESQNIQRRATAERNDAIRYANAELMRILIPVLEDFDRTFAASDSADKSILEGTRLVHANLVKALRDFGLEPIEAAGERFDPSIHEALMHQPSDEVPPGNVIEQVTRGYRLRDRVLRPARVIVSKAPEAS